MARVELKQLRKQFGSTVAVDDVDLVIEDREFMVLVGPSGCGKSTVLRMIAGLEDPTGGGIWIDGEQVNHRPPKDRDVAMVFQNYALYPHMSVFDNMAFSLKLRRVSKEETRSKVHDAARILDLEPVLERKPAQLSGGQRQRVALGRAIVRDPKVFLFDEPLSNLDAKLRNQTRAELAHLHEQLQATMVYVTHDQVEAMTMGTRIAALSAGRLQQVDEPLTLYNRPRNVFVAGFIGSPAMNLISGTIETNDFVAPILRFTAPEVAKGGAGQVTFGIRPEDLALEPSSTSKAHFEGLTELLEPLGPETFVHIRVDSQLITAKLDGGVRLDTGGTVRLYFDPNDGHFFDTRDGSRLT